MANVLLIAPTGAEDPGIEAYASPHHGLHRIAGYLRYRGHCVDVWDKWYSNFTLEGILNKRSWDLIGFSTISHTLPWDIEVMREAKRFCPWATLVIGGMEAAMNYQEIFDHAPVDALVLAEGEYVLADYLDHPDRIPEGMMFRRLAKGWTQKNLWDTYQHIDFASMGYERYWDQIRQATGNADYEPDIRLVTETHCNRNCVFCSQTNFHRRATGKVQPPAYLEAEQIYLLLRRAKEQLPALKRVYFDGDDFCQPRYRALDFFQTYAQSEPLRGFKYLAEAGIPSIDEDLVQIMARGGLTLLNMGLENCSQKVLKSLGKPQSVSKAFDIVGWCRKYDVEPYVLIILFPPESTIEDLWTNVETLTSLMECGATLSIIPFMRPYRGTKMYEMDYQFEWDAITLNGGTNLKQPRVVWCKDQQVRSIQEQFMAQWGKRLEEIKANESRAYRRRTAPEMVKLLRRLLQNCT